MIRAALAFFLLCTAFVLGLADDWRMVNMTLTAAAILAAWSAVRPSYRTGRASPSRWPA